MTTEFVKMISSEVFKNAGSIYMSFPADALDD